MLQLQLIEEISNNKNNMNDIDRQIAEEKGKIREGLAETMQTLFGSGTESSGYS